MEIVTVSDPREIECIFFLTENALDNGKDLHFAVQGGKVLVKSGGGMWSYPLGNSK